MAGRRLANRPSCERIFSRPRSGRISRSILSHFGPPYRAQQHRIGLTRALQGLVGQRHAVLVDGRATDDVLGQFEAELEPVVGQFQHLDRFRHDFRADTVTGENQDLLAHNTLLSFIH